MSDVASLASSRQPFKLLILLFFTAIAGAYVAEFGLAGFRRVLLGLVVERALSPGDALTCGDWSAPDDAAR